MNNSCQKGPSTDPSHAISWSTSPRLRSWLPAPSPAAIKPVGRATDIDLYMRWSLRDKLVRAFYSPRHSGGHVGAAYTLRVFPDARPGRSGDAELAGLGAVGSGGEGGHLVPARLQRPVLRTARPAQLVAEVRHQAYEGKQLRHHYQKDCPAEADRVIQDSTKSWTLKV